MDFLVGLDCSCSAGCCHYRLGPVQGLQVVRMRPQELFRVFTFVRYGTEHVANHLH